MLIEYVESRIEVDGVFLWYNRTYPGGVLNPKAAEEWWTDYREKLAELGIELELTPTAAEEPQAEAVSDTGSEDDDEFERLLNEFIQSELDKAEEEKTAQ